MGDEYMKMPLENIRILDLTQVIAGSYGSMILGDLGAEVIKIEPPSGDPIRDGAGHRIQGQRTSYLSFNRNKKSVVLMWQAQLSTTTYKGTSGNRQFRNVAGGQSDSVFKTQRTCKENVQIY